MENLGSSVFHYEKLKKKKKSQETIGTDFKKDTQKFIWKQE